MTELESKHSGWAWVPSLYIFQGIPSHLVMTTAAIIFCAFGINASAITLWLGIVSLPWSLKPLWAPIVERNWSLRRWTITTEGAIGVTMLALALTLTTESPFVPSLILMTIMAFLSSTHDIACDGYYMHALDVRAQSFFVGIRSTFYRIAMIAAGGLLPIAADWAINGAASGSIKPIFSCGPTEFGWAVGVGATGLVLLTLWAINNFAMPRVDEVHGRQDDSLKILGRSLRSFFTHPGAIAFVSFFLTYRLGEAQLSKIVPIFMASDKSAGGLGLTPAEYGVAYGTAGVIALTIGGILGGMAASRFGLRKTLWPMILMMNIPNLAYVALAHDAANAPLWAIYSTIIVEQLGYGFGFTAYMLCILTYVRDSEYKAAEYSIGTSLMSLGIIIPSLPSGKLCEWMGYESFFTLACVATIPGMLCAWKLKFPDD